MTAFLYQRSLIAAVGRGLEAATGTARPRATPTASSGASRSSTSGIAWRILPALAQARAVPDDESRFHRGFSDARRQFLPVRVGKFLPVARSCVTGSRGFLSFCLDGLLARALNVGRRRFQVWPPSSSPPKFGAMLPGMPPPGRLSCWLT